MGSKGLFRKKTPVNSKKCLHFFQYQLDGSKYLGGICNLLISKHITQFLVFYTPQGGTELSDRVSGVKY